MTNLCQARGCKEPASWFMCDRHWMFMPKALRDHVSKYWEKGFLSEGLFRAGLAAIEYVAHHEMNTDDLKWKPVVGFKGLYEVSEFGHVRDLRTGKIRKWEVNSVNYPQMGLYKGADRKKKHWRFIHILVAEAFIGPRPDGHEVNHDDGNKMRPYVTNLSYETKSGNVKHARKAGLHRQRPRRKNQRELVLERVRQGGTVREIAGEFDISPTTVRNYMKDSST